MQLPIPIFYKDKIYDECEIDQPESGDIVSTVNAIDKNGDTYTSLIIWLASAITALISDGERIEDKVRIKSLLKWMHYKTAEYITIQSLLLIHDDDEIEGIYSCPRCDNQIIAEKVVEDGLTISDTVDYVSQLKVDYMEDYEQTFFHNMEKPVDIMNNNQPIETIENVDFYYPTMNHCINAFARTGARDKARVQLRIYAEAIQKINGNEVDNKWRNNFGIYFMNKIRNMKGDLMEIFKKGREYGLDPTVKKECNDCGKEWKEQVNPMNFFASALRSIT